MITKLDDLLELVKSKGKKRLVAAYANDSHTIAAVSAAIDRGIVEATLVGDIDTMRSSRRPTTTRLVPKPWP